MFSKKEQLIKRTPKNGVDRKQYINLLVEEFLQTTSFAAKHQVLANLVNFAYDPINYEFLRESRALDLFLNELTTPTDPTLTHYSCSGICNLCLDPENASYIIKYDGINLLINLLKSDNEETKLNAITSLLYLTDFVTKDSIATPSTIKLLLQYKNSEEPRLKNLATIFLENLYGTKKLETIQSDLKNCEDKQMNVENIPLPKV